MLKIGDGPDSLTLPGNTNARVFYDASDPAQDALVVSTIRVAAREIAKAHRDIEGEIFERVFYRAMGKRAEVI